LYRVVQFCWAAPLIVGLACLTLYAVTRAQAIAVLGFFVVLGGTALFALGALCLIIFWALLRHCAADIRQTWRKRALVVFGLLVLNFPIAFGCMWLGTWLMSRFTVTVVNNSAAPVREVIIGVAGERADLGTLAPGDRASRTFSIRNDGDLEFWAVQDGANVSGEAGAYLDMTHGSGTQGIVTFDASGARAIVIP
jgi:hypothetical protein